MKSFPLMSALLLMNMLEKIQSRLEHLSKSERKVAEVILATPAQAIHSSIAALALEAGVSEPTVNRFCRSLETRGFLTSNCIWPRALRTARSMLTGMSMKTTALSHTREKYSNRPWRV
jgi:DNA-binding IclR family transcriptional regulator